MKTKLIAFLSLAVLLIALIAACKKKSSTSTSTGTCSDGILNQNETNIDCGGVCSVCQTCSDGIQNQGETSIDCGGPCGTCPITYPQSDVYGPNFLRNDTITIVGSDQSSSGSQTYYSMSARVPAGASIKVVMSFTPTSITSFLPAGWTMVFGTSTGWSTLSYDQNTNTQQFFATGLANCNLRFMFNNHGLGKAEIYENGSTTPTRTKVFNNW